MKKTVEYEYPTNFIYCWRCAKTVECYENHVADIHEKYCPECHIILDIMIDASISTDQLEINE